MASATGTGSGASGGVGNKEDVDLFLTGVESKLRGPFSSLDLAKAVTTTTLRGSLTPSEYLELISQVLARTDKVIQLRMLIAMLGLDPSEDTNDQIFAVLQQAQEGPLHEEWVRTVSGLIQGMMFYSSKKEDEEENESSEDGENKSNGGGDRKGETTKETNPQDSRESCRGEEARKLLDKTCKEIIARVAKEIKKCNKKREPSIDDGNSDIGEKNGDAVDPHHKDDDHDMNPFYAPFRYILLSPTDVEKLIPESKDNPHFTVNKDADILNIDERLDLERAKEEKSHKPVTLASTAVSDKIVNTSTADVNIPGFKQSKKNSLTKSKVPPKKSSMFMPTKKPIAMRTAGSKGTHVRKAGAAQALLAKNRMKQRMAGKLGASAASAGAAGASSRALGSKSKSLTSAGGRSKMKMIDVNEVDTLTKEHKDRDQKMAMDEKRNSRKRQIHEVAAKKGIFGDKAKRLKESVKKTGLVSKKAPKSTPPPKPVLEEQEDAQKLEEKPTFPKVAEEESDDDDDDDDGRDFGFGIDQNESAASVPAPAPAPTMPPRQQQQQMAAVSRKLDNSGNAFLDSDANSAKYELGVDANALMALQQQRQHEEHIRRQQQQELQLQLHQQELQMQQRQEEELRYQLQLRQEQHLQEQILQDQIRDQLIARQQAAAAAELQHYQQQQRLQQKIQEQEMQQFQQQQQQKMLAQQYAQQQQQHQQQQTNRRGTATNDSWRILLQERSNKLSNEDRLRVQQFFERQYNPTPDVPVYKMKLHEARTTDPATGQPIKETYYLELDYQSFTSKQSKKVKKY